MHTGLLPAVTAAMSVSCGTSRAGCQAAVLPRETCFRRAQQVILVPASLTYDLILQELQPLRPVPGFPETLITRQRRKEERVPEVPPTAHKVRPDQDTCIARRERRGGVGGQ